MWPEVPHFPPAGWSFGAVFYALLGGCSLAETGRARKVGWLVGYFRTVRDFGWQLSKTPRRRPPAKMLLARAKNKNNSLWVMPACIK